MKDRSRLSRPAVKVVQGLFVAEAMPNSIQPSILGQTRANLFDGLFGLRRECRQLVI
jgi:hypothetical protein